MKSKTYEEFVDKFKPKLTTDDCYTPPLIYDTVRDAGCVVLYLCDGARCAGCSREYCRHTTDLAHALHYDAEPDAETLEAKFDRYGDYWVERG